MISSPLFLALEVLRNAKKVRLTLLLCWPFLGKNWLLVLPGSTLWKVGNQGELKYGGWPFFVVAKTSFAWGESLVPGLTGDGGLGHDFCSV